MDSDACAEIGVALGGEGKMILNQEERSFRAGDVTFVGSQVHHTTWSEPDTFSAWAYLFLDAERLLGRNLRQPEAIRKMTSTGAMILHQDEVSWALRLTQAVMGEMRDREEGYQDCVRGLLMALFSRMLRRQPAREEASPRDNHVLMPALAWIRDQYAADFSIDELAARCHLSPTHFRRLFREQIGTTPLDYLHQVRITASCSLLLDTDDSVASVAGQVGYASLSCFNRHFLQMMGDVPSRWRRNQGSSPRPSVMTFTGWTRAETTEEILKRRSGGPRPEE